jgi:hypothetical protein
MKPYFSKLLTEQERANSKAKSAKWGKRLKYNPDSDYEDEPVRASSSRHQQQRWSNDGNKSLTDSLGSLHGFLRKNIGKPWNEVYSHLAKNLDRRSVSGHHVWTHIWDFVEKDALLYTDGAIRTVRGYTPHWYYVHPHTGILCDSRNNGWFNGRPKKKKTNYHFEIKLNDRTYYALIDGIWYHTKKSVINVYSTERGWRDKYYVRTTQEAVYSNKRQLGKKELKKLGLKSGQAHIGPVL